MSRAAPQRKRGRDGGGAAGKEGGAFARLKKTSRAELQNVVNGFRDSEAKECLITCEKARREGWRQKFVGDEEMNRLIMQMRTIEEAANRVSQNAGNAARNDVTFIKTQLASLMAKYEEGKHECPICTEKMLVAQMQITNCGHCFHTNCLGTWKQRNNTCPACRKALE